MAICSYEGNHNPKPLNDFKKIFQLKDWRYSAQKSIFYSKSATFVSRINLKNKNIMDTSNIIALVLGGTGSVISIIGLIVTPIINLKSKRLEKKDRTQTCIT